MTVRYTDKTPTWRFTYEEGDSETELFLSSGETMVLDSSPVIIETEPTEQDALDRMDELGLERKIIE